MVENALRYGARQRVKVCRSFLVVDSGYEYWVVVEPPLAFLQADDRVLRNFVFFCDVVDMEHPWRSKDELPRFEW